MAVLLVGARFVVADQPTIRDASGPIVAAVEVVSLSCGLAGVGLTLTRGVCRNWFHRIAVLLVFGLICIGNGVLLAFIVA
jgi:hypothetical protein